MIGLLELKLMIDEAWLNTMSSGRKNACMKVALLNIIHVTGARPSSFGAIHAAAAEEGKVGFLHVPPFPTLTPQSSQYARLGDVYWIAEKEDEFSYIMKAELHHFKVAYKPHRLYNSILTPSTYRDITAGGHHDKTLLLPLLGSPNTFPLTLRSSPSIMFASEEPWMAYPPGRTFSNASCLRFMFGRT